MQSAMPVCIAYKTKHNCSDQSGMARTHLFCQCYDEVIDIKCRTFSYLTGYYDLQ